MRRIGFTLLVFLSLACARDRPAPEGERATVRASAPTAAAADTGGAFVLLRGTDTLATERFSRAPGRLEGRLHLPSGRWLDYRAEIGPAQLVTRLAMTREGGGGKPQLRSTAVLGGDSLVRTVRLGAAPADVRRDTVPAGIVAYLLPSAALAEQVLRRARSLGGDSAEVPVAALNGGAVVQERVSVHWLPGDSARVVVSGNEVILAVDSAGRILGGRNPNLGLRLERVGG